jgi:tryptophan-rich sensory protein
MLTAVIICLLAGFVGSYFTLPAIPTWYASLNKPFFNPPNWIFGPVWTALFIMMGIAAALVWEKGIAKGEVRLALAFFAAQLFFNVIWSILFFGAQAPLYALFDIVILWVLILMTILKFFPLSGAAAWLLVPYILWVSFASFLNLTIVLLNR